jgi:hypothetical protein
MNPSEIDNGGEVVELDAELSVLASRALITTAIGIVHLASPPGRQFSS